MSHSTIKPQGCTKNLDDLVKEFKPTDEIIRNFFDGFQNCIYTDLFHDHETKTKTNILLNKLVALDRAIITAKDGDKYLLKRMQIPIIKKIIKLLEEEY